MTNKFIERYGIKENIHAVDGSATIIPLQTLDSEEVNFLRIDNGNAKFESNPLGQFTVIGEEFDGAIFFTRTPQEALIINQVTGKTAIVYYMEKNIKPVLDEIYNSGCPNIGIVMVDNSQLSSLSSIKEVCSKYSLVKTHASADYENMAELSVQRGFAAVTTAISDIESIVENVSTGRQIRFKRVTDLGDIKGTEWIIDEIIQDDGFINIFGPSGQYKSFVALDMACCVASGRQYHGRDTRKTGVLYVCGEGEDGINSRIKAWQEENGHSDELDVFMTSDPVRLLNEGYQDLLVKEIKDLIEATGIEIGCIIFDTMNRCFGDGDENSTRDMTMFTDACIDLRRETSMSVILVHHTSTSNPRQARGNGSLRASLEAEINVLKPMNEDGEFYGHVELNVTKQKNGHEIDPMYFIPKIVDLGNDLKGRPVTSLVMKSSAVIDMKIEEMINDSNANSKKLGPRSTKIKNNFKNNLDNMSKKVDNKPLAGEDLIMTILRNEGGSISRSELKLKIQQDDFLRIRASTSMDNLSKRNMIAVSGDNIIIK